MMERDNYHAVGRIYPRQDGIAKVTGQEKYSSDISIPHMWHARVLRSPYAHAIIKNIDTGLAEKKGAVCITFHDIPKIKYNERIVSIPEKLFKDRYVFADRARHVGEAIAAVAAETEELAEKAIKLIKVEYEKLPPVLDPFKAMEPGCIQVYDSILLGNIETKIENNIACSREISDGNIEKGFEEADLIMENEYRTGRIYHAQLETKSVVCQPEPHGGITVWPTTQSIHNTRQLLGEIFNIPLNKVNVKRVPIGGSFGSSIQMNSCIPVCVALALKARRPVRLVLSREEDMYDHCKYPAVIWLKIGAKKDGILTAGHMKVVVDIGAHNTQAYPLLGCMAGWWVSLYRLQHLRFEGKAVYTNKIPACAMQGYGNPQITFAVESQMDILSEKLNIDSIELRLKNYVGLGETFWGQGPTIRSVIKSCGVEELLKTGAELIGWNKRLQPEQKTGRIRKGTGMARGFHTSGTGAPAPGEVIDYSSAFIKINEDGSVDLQTALMDHGGGSLDAGAKIVAEELGVPLEKVGICPSDTFSTTYDVCTHATRGVYCGGGAIHKVARQVKQKLLEFASRILEAAPEDMEVRHDVQKGQGVIYVKGSPEKNITIGEVAKTAQIKSWGSIASVDSHRQSSCPPAFVAHFVEVEVDTETGKIETKKAVLGSDAGTVINPDMAAGQLEGGLSKGLGYALLEEAIYDEATGELANKGRMTDVKIPTSCEMPEVDNVKIFFANTKEPTGPFGAKGIGEAALNPTAAAFSNAIYNAVGVRFKEIPITPEKVFKALKEDEEGKKK